MSKSNDSQEKKKGGSPISVQAMKSKILAHGGELIDFFFEQMRNEKLQASVRQSAANKLIDKILPSLKAQEFVDEDGKVYKILLDLPGVIMKPDDNRKPKV